MLEKKKLLLYIIRECFVNIVGYKMKIRGLFKRSRINNVAGNIDKDIKDKGFKHYKLVQKILSDLSLNPKKNRFVSCSGENTCEHVSPRPSLLTGEKKIQRCNTHIHTPLCIPAGKAGTLCIDLCVYSCSSEVTSISPPLVCVASRYFEYKPSFSLRLLSSSPSLCAL